MTTPNSISIPKLRADVRGPVIGPDDAGYDQARAVFYGGFDLHPAVIVRVADEVDIGRVIALARETGLELAVRSGGHSVIGQGVSDGGIVIDLAGLRAIDVDAEGRTAWAQTGLTALEFTTATHAHGLGVGFGDTGSVGIGGITLGGGVGYLVRKHGLTCDNLVGAELVTPGGDVVHARPDENAELLWALRGGGGNFGVATRLEFRLHALDGVVGGLLSYAGEGVREAFRAYRDIVARSPRDLSCQAVLALDDSLAPALVVIPCYTGSDPDPAQLRELRAAPGLLDDGVGPRSFAEQQSLVDSPYGEQRHYWKGHFVNELPDELIDVLLDRVAALGRPPGDILIESLHGAPKDVDPGTSALSYRGAAFNVSAMATWQDSVLDAEHIAWSRETAAAIQPWAVSGGYANYMQADEPIERVRAAFGEEAFDRLQALKRRYDPGNVLRRNQNIPPG